MSSLHELYDVSLRGHGDIQPLLCPQVSFIEVLKYFD